MKNKRSKLIKIIVAAVIVLALAFAALYIKSLIDSAPVPAPPINTTNSTDVGPQISPQTDPQPNTNTNTDPQPDSNTNVDPQPEPDTGTQPSGPVYYSSDVLSKLKNTDVFNKSAIEHIFMGTVNSNGKGSGYHYDMIKDSPGKIVESTRSKTDKNGCYTAYVEVDGHEKEHYSTFYPDEWTPQQVVDAIVAARKDALDNNRHSGDTYIGYYNGIEINMYLDSKNRVVSAYPIYSKK